MIEIGRQYVALDANSWLAHFFLGVGHEGSGQTLQAIPEYQKASSYPKAIKIPQLG